MSGNLVGAWVFAENDSFMGSKKHCFKKFIIETSGDGNLVRPWIFGVKESEFKYKSGSEVKVTPNG